METEKKLTGYSSIENPKRRIVEDLKIRNKDNMKVVAGEYFGSKFTYAQTFEMFENYKKAFIAIDGLNEDTITISAPSTIASVNVFYGAMDANKVVNMTGKIWLHTGDLGYVDEEGFVVLNGRARRVIVRLGFKISAYTIEDKISEHPAVKECVAVEVKDSVEEHVPMVYIVLKDDKCDKEKIQKSIYDKCYSELKEYEIPKYFRIVDSLPYTQNNKYDFRLLEQWGNEYVDTYK